MTDDPEQNPDVTPVSAPVRDRRLHRRQRVHSLSYVELGDGNGGIVLNISEGGIAVQAAEIVDDTEGLIAMRIEVPRSRKRLEVSGEIVWIGESRKEAGLRFVDLQEDALRRIRLWMVREASPETAEEESEDEAEVEARVQAPAEKAEERMAEEAGAQEEEVFIETEEQIFDDEEQEVTNEGDEPAAEDDESVELAEELVEESEQPVVPTEQSFVKAAEPMLAAPAARKQEDRAPAIAPPVPAFEKKTQIPVSPYDTISGTHGAPSFGVAATAPPALRHASAESSSALFPRPHVPAEPKPADDGWKSFRVQLQSGWFLALLILLLAMISFIAGMAVRRGALNGMMGDSDEVVQPKSAPSPSAATIAPNPAAIGSAAAAPATPAEPLQIEIVDSANRQWTIPAATGSNRPDANVAPRTPRNYPATQEGKAADITASSSAGQRSAPAGSSTSEKSGAPLMLSLPETPISASGSVAIRSRGLVPVPAAEAQSAQNSRNLQIGQLTSLVEPIYPPEARRARLEGTVKLHAVVAVDGKIQSLEPISGPEPLVSAAITAMREWRYSPTLLNGKPIETQEDVSFVFRLPN